MIRTIEQWAWGATMDHWKEWRIAREKTEARRPRRRSSLGLAFAAAVIASIR